VGTFQLHKATILTSRITFSTYGIRAFTYSGLWTSWSHDFRFMNSYFQLHVINILTSRIHIHEVEIIFIHKLRSWIREVEIMNSWKWNREVEHMNSRSWNREFVKMKSWIHENEIVNSWTWNVPIALSNKTILFPDWTCQHRQ
jgi:hypothetical protein